MIAVTETGTELLFNRAAKIAFHGDATMVHETCNLAAAQICNTFANGAKQRARWASTRAY